MDLMEEHLVHKCALAGDPTISQAAGGDEPADVCYQVPR